MICPKCKYDNTDNARFCAFCGEDLYYNGRSVVFEHTEKNTSYVGLKDYFTGNILIEPRFYSIENVMASDAPKTFYNKRILVCREYSRNCCSAYNNRGELVIPGEHFDYIWHFPWLSMMVCWCLKANKHCQPGYYAFDENGRFLFKYKYDCIGSYFGGEKSGYMTEARNSAGLYGFIDIRTGQPLLDFKWKDASSFQNGYAEVQDKETKKWGVINTRGEIVVPCQYFELLVFSDGTVKYKKNWYSFQTEAKFADIVLK